MAKLPDAAILCGGMGTRLRGVLGGVPKGLAAVGGRPFLEVLVRDLAGAGVGRVVLCTGVGADQIRAHFAGGDWGAEIVFSAEPAPLGTGGALGLARPHLTTDPVLAMNGDSRVEGFDWAGFAAAFDPARAAGAVAVVATDGRDDTGRIRLDRAGRIQTFAEKQVQDGGAFQNAGIYLLSRRLLDRIPPGPSSMERDLLPAWLPEGLSAFICRGALTDIGTPERLARAQATGAPPA